MSFFIVTLLWVNWNVGIMEGHANCFYHCEQYITIFILQEMNFGNTQRLPKSYFRKSISNSFLNQNEKIIQKDLTLAELF